MNVDVTKIRAWSTQQASFAIGIAVAVTFSATMIWARFLYMEQQIQTNSNREDTREIRSVADRAAIWVEINKMKEEHK